MKEHRSEKWHKEQESHMEHLDNLKRVIYENLPVSFQEKFTEEYENALSECSDYSKVVKAFEKGMRKSLNYTGITFKRLQYELLYALKAQSMSNPKPWGHRNVC